jgi:hypothetical protein
MLGALSDPVTCRPLVKRPEPDTSKVKTGEDVFIPTSPVEFILILTEPLVCKLRAELDIGPIVGAPVTPELGVISILLVESVTRIPSLLLPPTSISNL